MAEELQAKVVDAEEPQSIAEKEQEIQKDSSFDEESGMYKLDLNKINEVKPEENAVQEQETEDGVLRGSSENEEAGQEAEVELQEVRQEEVEAPVLEEVTDEEEQIVNEPEQVEEEVQEQVQPEEQEPQLDLPENIQDLIKFMNETGGTIEDLSLIHI